MNLANQSGTEGNLGRSFKQEAERYAKVKPGFEVVSFDFHHECKGMRYDRSALLHPSVKLDATAATHEEFLIARVVPSGSSSERLESLAGVHIVRPLHFRVVSMPQS